MARGPGGRRLFKQRAVRFTAEDGWKTLYITAGTGIKSWPSFETAQAVYGGKMLTGDMKVDVALALYGVELTGLAAGFVTKAKTMAVGQLLLDADEFVNAIPAAKRAKLLNFVAATVVGVTTLTGDADSLAMVNAAIAAADQHNAAASELEAARDTDALGMSGTAEDYVLDRQDIHDSGRPSPRPTLRKHKRGADPIPPPNPARKRGPKRKASASVEEDL